MVVGMSEFVYRIIGYVCMRCWFFIVISFGLLGFVLMKYIVIEIFLLIC